MTRFCKIFLLVFCVGSHRSVGDDGLAIDISDGHAGASVLPGFSDGSDSSEHGTPMQALEIHEQDSSNDTGWPAPEDITVTRSVVSNTSMAAEFRMTWNITSTQDLRAFRTVICTPKCIGPEVPPSQFAIKFSAPFNINFNVSVVALFEVPESTQLLPRPSDIYDHQSGVGPPSRVPTIKAHLENDTLELVWDPPATPNGPIDFYILEVSDALNSTNQQQLTLNETQVDIDVSGMSGYAFEAQILAVNVDQNSTDTFSSPVFRTNIPYKRAGKPSQLTVTSRKTDTIRVEISPPTSEELPFTPYYEINSLSYIQENHVTDAVVFTHLSPYEKVSFNVSTCYRTELLREFVCGEPLQAEERSKVSAPSRVSTLSTANSGSGVVLRWTPPSQPNGPIDGYKVFITDTNEPKKETNHTLASSVSSITFAPEAFIRGKPYNLTVAAFNVDPETEEIYLGERATVTQWSPGSWLTVIIVVSVLVVLGGLGAGVLYYVKARRNTSAFFNF